MNSVSDDAEASNEPNHNNYLNWQQTKTKQRKRNLSESPKLYKNKRKALVSDDIPSTSNKFAALQNNDDDDDNDDENPTTPKPPPIYIPDVVDVSNMICNIGKIIPKEHFSFKSLNNNQIRLMVNKVDSYRTLVKYLEGRSIGFHTFQLKQERSYRVVIKGLHHSTPIEDIKAALLCLGHGVRNVTNVRSRVSKEPLPMFFVDLDPQTNNKEIYNIRHINNAIVTVEAPIKRDELVQCHRCQLFGHTKAYCKRPFSCVKCGLNHPTAECTKNTNTPARCINCLKSHTANYKGCQIYQNLIAKRRNIRNVNNNHANYAQVNFNNFPQLNQNNNDYQNTDQHINNQSYSDVLRNNNIENKNNNSNTIERIESMLNNLLNMITMLISKLCK